MAIAFVQAKQTATTTTGTATVVFTSNNTLHNLIVLGVEVNSSPSATTISVTDTQGNTYVSAIGPLFVNGVNNIQIFYVKDCRAGANTISVTSSVTPSYFNLIAVEYSGADNTAPLDGAGASATGSSTSAASGSFTVTTGDLVVGLATMQGSMVVGSGFTSRGTDTFSMLEDQTAAGTSVNSTFTGTTGAWGAQGVAFKVAASTFVAEDDSWPLPPQKPFDPAITVY